MTNNTDDRYIARILYNDGSAWQDYKWSTLSELSRRWKTVLRPCEPKCMNDTTGLPNGTIDEKRWICVTAVPVRYNDDKEQKNKCVKY